MWENIRDVPSGNIKSIWRRSDKNSRMYASNPAVQNIKKERRPFGLANNGEVWNIDYKAQVPNIRALLTGNEPHYTQESFSNALGLPKYKVKSIVNNYLNRRHLGNHIHDLKNEYNLEEGLEYKYIINEFEEMFLGKNNLHKKKN